MAFLVGMAARALAGNVAKKAAVDLVAKQVLKKAATGAVRGAVKQAAGTAVRGGLNGALEYGVQATKATAQGAVKTTARASMKSAAADIKSAALTGRQMMTGGNQIAGKRVVQAARWGNRMMGGDGMTGQERDGAPQPSGMPFSGGTGGGGPSGGGPSGGGGAAPRGAFGLLRTMAEGGARGQSILNGTNFSPTRGFTTVALPTRTQAQASTWGKTGQMGQTAYSGFGQMQLDRGFRGVSHTPGHAQMQQDDRRDIASEMSPGEGANGVLGAVPTPRSEHFSAGAMAASRPNSSADDFATAMGHGTAATAQPVFHSTIKEEIASRAAAMPSVNVKRVGGAALDQTAAILNSPAGRAASKGMPALGAARMGVNAVQKVRGKNKIGPIALPKQLQMPF